MSTRKAPRNDGELQRGLPDFNALQIPTDAQIFDRAGAFSPKNFTMTAGSTVSTSFVISSFASCGTDSTAPN
jgi:hypothetical protein